MMMRRRSKRQKDNVAHPRRRRRRSIKSRIDCRYAVEPSATVRLATVRRAVRDVIRAESQVVLYKVPTARVRLPSLILGALKTALKVSAIVLVPSGLLLTGMAVMA